MAEKQRLLPEFDDQDDEKLPEPIYLRLNNHLFDYRESYYEDDGDDDSEGEIADDQIGLDLTAPPPES